LLRRSSPIVLPGPWPQMNAHSSPSVSSFVRIDVISASCAVREICAADGAAEQHVAHDQELLRAVDEHDRAGRVPGAVPDLELVAADRDGVALLEPAIGRDVACAHTVGEPLRG
jgi:hypothetical protein